MLLENKLKTKHAKTSAGIAIKNFAWGCNNAIGDATTDTSVFYIISIKPRFTK